MNYFWIAFVVAIGWKIGEIAFDIASALLTMIFYKIFPGLKPQKKKRTIRNDYTE